MVIPLTMGRTPQTACNALYQMSCNKYKYLQRCTPWLHSLTTPCGGRLAIRAFLFATRFMKDVFRVSPTDRRVL